MKQLLFVQGHNTFSNHEVYEPIRAFCELHNIRVTFLRYDLNMDIRKVYRQLCKQVVKYDYLAGHSMGGYFVMKLIVEHPELISKLERCILLMPLIVKDPLIDTICKIPFVRDLQLPKQLIYPSHKLSNNMNIFDNLDFHTKIPLKQIVDCYASMNDAETVVNTLNRNSNCRLIYAIDEKFTEIDLKVLNRIKHKCYVSGKHNCFMNPKSDFFDRFCETIFD